LRLEPTLQPCLEPTSNSHRYPSSGSPSNCAFQPILDLRPRSAFQLRLLAPAFQASFDLRLRSTIQLCLPTSSESHRRLFVRLWPSAVLLTCVVRSTFQPHLPAYLLTCVSSPPSSSALRLVFGLRLCTCHPALPFNRLSDSHRQLVVPALPSNRPRTCVSG
jgi:hypothetical protein